MITARYNRWVSWFWKTFTRLAIKQRFHSVVIEGKLRPDPNRAILLLGNHISWWDGFWAFYLNERLFKKQFHAMMLEHELRSRSLLRYGGAFSVNPGKGKSRESLQYAASLLAQAQNLVLMYPQGKIHSLYQDKIAFKKGSEILLQMVPLQPQIIFMACFVEFLEKPKPRLYIYLDEYRNPSHALAQPLEAAYQAHFERSLEQQKRIQK